MQADVPLLTSPFRWTNHPLVDMGIASLVAFAKKNTPEEITSSDVEAFATYAETAYFSPEIASYLSVLFTSNFLNPSFSAEKKKQFVKTVLRSYQSNPDSSLPPCAYCGSASVRRAHRDLIPMLTGREHVNFSPNGTPGLALCGNCIVALQALSIGSPMCSGRSLVVSCDDPAFVVALVKAWQPEIRKRIQLSEQSGQKLSPITRPLTRTIEALAKIEAERETSPSITVYHLSNSGQGPQVDIFFLPSSVVRFVQRANAANYSPTWKEVVRRAWDFPPKPQKGKASVDEKKAARNYLYEDLFALPDRSGSFVRTYFLRKSTRFARAPGDPRSNYSGWQDYVPGLWNLTGLFLQEVMAMESDRIEAIRKLGDALADEIATENDRRLWWAAYKADAYRQARLALIQVSQRRVKRGSPPVVSLDDFLEVFEEGEELPRVDWRLAWDLVLIRVIERLYETKWFDKNRDVLGDEEKEPEMEEA
ncbi:MAG: type I-B CRISPR-associated protein Cas8b1/Cst1 [Betaproteobacteria bacterium]